MNTTITTDPVADMLTRMRNAMGARKHEITLPHSKLKEAIARLLLKSRFVTNVTVDGEGTSKTLSITLHDAGENARITEIKTLSTPGRRLYVGAQEIPVVRRGRGIVVLSTSKGLMTGAEAKAAGVGGELICSIY